MSWQLALSCSRSGCCCSLSRFGRCGDDALVSRPVPDPQPMKAVQMNEIHDIFLRAHTVVPTKKSRSQRESPWPDRILVYDCETLTDPTLKLTFGAYRICKLVKDRYLCEEEGLFYPDDLPEWQRTIMVGYVKAEGVYADIEAKSF